MASFSCLVLTAGPFCMNQEKREPVPKKKEHNSTKTQNRGGGGGVLFYLRIILGGIKLNYSSG